MTLQKKKKENLQRKAKFLVLALASKSIIILVNSIEMPSCKFGKKSFVLSQP